MTRAIVRVRSKWRRELQLDSHSQAAETTVRSEAGRTGDANHPVVFEQDAGRSEIQEIGPGHNVRDIFAEKTYLDDSVSFSADLFVDPND